ncbi:MAG TPA: hypothetical protein VIC26_08295 [Marinagarivorans sp.]
METPDTIVSKPLAVEKFLRPFVTVVFIIAAISGLLWQYPFQALPENHPKILAVFRVAFFALVLCRLWFGRWALSLLWGYSARSYLQPIWGVWLVVALCGLVGVGGSLPSYLNLLLFFIVYYRSKYYSIEDIYFQLATFVLIFLPTNSSYSIDALVGLHFLDFSVKSHVLILLVLNLYAWLLALMLLSAAVEKALTENWRKGLSFYYFVALPHLVLPRWHWLRRHKWLCQLASWLTVLGQGTLFIGYFFPVLMPFLWLKQIVFGLMLICIVDFSYIGQLFVVQFLLFLLISTGGGDASAVLLTQASTSAGLVATVFIVSAFIIMATLRSFLSEQSLYKRWIPNAADKVVRIATGSCPVKVFSDAHLFGLYLYRVVDEQGHNWVPAFNNDGGPGQLQRWHPRYYQGAMYSVTDACLAKRYCAHFDDRRNDRINDLLVVALERAGRCSKMTLQVKAVNPSKDYEPDVAHWLDGCWTDIYEGYMESGKLVARWINSPPPVVRTARDYQR